MPQRLIFFVVALFGISNGEIFAQNMEIKPIVLIVDSHPFMQKPLANPKMHFSRPVTRYYSSPELDPDLVKKFQAPLSAAYYQQQLGVFCRAEFRVEKATSLPIRFRLGSLQYTDYMEQKPNAQPGH